MPVTETEKELQIESNGISGMKTHNEHGSSWIETILRLWSQRLRIGAWTLVGTIVSAGLAPVIGKYEATAELMPPEATSSSGLYTLPAPFLGRADGRSRVVRLLVRRDPLA